ncbi:MAG: alpha/beta hydrolase [Synergistaceae bacterium]|jgi:pimeloyl-ACP methyl ester carboxylesterase|nr:alpha/beta hydrolase [Synergistaceae bacterium]
MDADGFGEFLKTTRLERLRVRCYDRGAGEKAVLFLHGWGSDLSVFRAFFTRAADAFRVCALDLPGFGDSEEPPLPWGVDDYADFVAAFLKDFGVREVVLVGHSFGGRIAVKLAAWSAASLPFTIPKIVLVDSAGVRRGRTLAQWARLVLYKRAAKVLSLPIAEKISPGVLERWRLRMGSADYRSASPRMRQCLVKVVNEDLTPLFPLVSCPTLLVWGVNDQDTPLSDARLMERLIPDAGLVALQNAGHYSFLDQPFVFGRVLESFLGLGETP